MVIMCPRVVQKLKPLYRPCLGMIEGAPDDVLDLTHDDLLNVDLVVVGQIIAKISFLGERSDDVIVCPDPQLFLVTDSFGSRGRRQNDGGAHVFFSSVKAASSSRRAL